MMCPQKTDARVTLISAVRLRAGTEEAHRALHERGVSAAKRLGGLVRHELVPSIPGAQPDTVALLTFQSRADLDRWLSPQERHDVLHAMSELTESQRSLNVVSGYGGWFTTGVTPAPRSGSRRWPWWQALYRCRSRLRMFGRRSLRTFPRWRRWPLARSPML